MKLNFSYNWNHKLDCNGFTTFRPFNSTIHYTGAHYDIFLNTKEKIFDLGTAKVITMYKMKLEKVTPAIALLDTGYSLEEFKKIITTMYKNRFPDINNVDFVLLFLQYVLHR